MDIKKLSTSFVSAFFIASCAAPAHQRTPEENLFTDLALAMCMGSAFENEAVKDDFNKSANGYIQRGNLPIEALDEIRNLINTWLLKDYSSKHGGQVQSAKCLDLRHSSELAEIYKKHDPCKSRGNWLDPSEYKTQCASSN